jgi:hypothetical protein
MRWYPNLFSASTLRPSAALRLSAFTYKFTAEPQRDAEFAPRNLGIRTRPADEGNSRVDSLDIGNLPRSIRRQAHSCSLPPPESFATVRLPSLGLVAPHVTSPSIPCLFYCIYSTRRELIPRCSLIMWNTDHSKMSLFLKFALQFRRRKLSASGCTRRPHLDQKVLIAVAVENQRVPLNAK